MIGKDNRYRLLPKKYMASQILGKPVRPDFKVNSLDMRVLMSGEVVVYLWELSSRKHDKGRENAVNCHEVALPYGAIFVYLERRCTSRKTSKS